MQRVKKTIEEVSLVGLLVVFLIGCGAHGLSDVKSTNEVDDDEENEEAAPTRIVINAPARELFLYQGDKLVYHFPIAIGSPAYKTPIGPRRITQIVWNPWWIPPDSEWARNDKPTPPGPANPLGPVKMDMGEAIRLHGTSKESSVGRPVSHGCMRMFNVDAVTLAWWIQSRHSTKTDPLLLSDYQQNRGQSFTINLDKPVPVEIVYNLFSIDRNSLTIHPDFYGRVGNKKRKVYELLEEYGFTKDQIDGFAIERLFNRSQSTTATIPLKELVPGKLVASNERLPDPVDESWRLKYAARYPRNRSFSIFTHIPHL